MRRFAFVLVIAAAACGGGDDTPPVGVCAEEGGAACFLPATAATTVDDGASAANWSCAADPVTTSTVEIDVSGFVKDFQEGTPLTGATVEAFASASDFSTPLETADTDATGAFTMRLPVGVPSRLAWRTTHPDAFDTYEINDPFDVSGPTVTGIERISVSQLTGAALPAFIGVTRQPGTGVVAGAVRDCDGKEVEHAVATLSSTSSAGGAAPTFVEGVQVYYFSNMNPDLPVKRSLREDTNADGLFVMVQIPPTSGTSTYFLQVWGFPSEAQVASGDMTLVSEFETRVIGDSVVIVDMDPTEGPL